MESVKILCARAATVREGVDAVEILTVVKSLEVLPVTSYAPTVERIRVCRWKNGSSDQPRTESMPGAPRSGRESRPD